MTKCTILQFCIINIALIFVLAACMAYDGEAEAGTETIPLAGAEFCTEIETGTEISESLYGNAGTIALVLPLFSISDTAVSFTLQFYGVPDISPQGHEFYQIIKIEITDDNGEKIQTITPPDDITRGAWQIEYGEYGVFFGDYNYDGHLDFMVFGRWGTAYRWVWNPTAGQFESWEGHVQAPELEDGDIDFNIMQRIHPDMPPFIFSVQGGYRDTYSDIWDTYFYVRQIDSVRITTLQGELIQEITGIYAQPSSMHAHNLYGLSFRDYNFDGYLDLVIHMRPGGNRDGGDFYYWLWCSDTSQFVFHEQLSREMRGNGNIDIIEARQRVQVWWSHVGGRHYTIYRHENGAYVPEEIIFWQLHPWRDQPLPDWWNPPEGEFNVRITHQNLINDTEEIVYEFWD